MQTDSKYQKEKEIGLIAIQKAFSLAKKMEKEILPVVNKKDLSPVTLIDFSIQALINLHLQKEFPDIPIMAEEDSLFLREAEHAYISTKVVELIRFFFPNINEGEILDAIDQGNFRKGGDGPYWVLDPIDGTRGFIRNEQYAIALALLDKGQVKLSFLGCPKLPYKTYEEGGIFFAEEKQGSFFIPHKGKKAERIFVSPSNEKIFLCEPHASSRSHSHTIALEVAKKLGSHITSLRLDSQCKYALVASGLASLYLRVPKMADAREKIWDHAPGALIVEEAGGKVTDLKGNALDYSTGETLKNNFGILASNGFLHEKALRIISSLDVL